MIHGADDKRQSAFSTWLRTGRWPRETVAAALELKFNPWHDPANGRFANAASGRRYGAGGGSANDDGGRGTGRAPAMGTRTPGSRRSDPPNRATEFVSGVGEGLRGVAKETAAGVRDTLTTRPTTTLRNAGRGLARMIDDVVAAEATPARIQVSRGIASVANASARDIGRATGSVAGNAALVAAPGAVVSKVSAARSLRLANQRPSFPPPQVGWVKETIRSNKPWKAYNDSADGARPNLAPTLMRTMSDGSKRPVKFDGIRGDYLIDRKMGVVDRVKAREQVVRQTSVLAEHRLLGTWEVPTPAQQRKARKLFKKMSVSNITVRVVKP